MGLVVQRAIIDANRHSCVYIGSPDGEGHYMEPEDAIQTAAMMMSLAYEARKFPGENRKKLSWLACKMREWAGYNAAKRQAIRYDESLSEKVNAAQGK